MSSPGPGGYPPYPPPWYGPPVGPGPYGYPPMGPPPALKPGVIPLRPLTLSEILNASITYVRTNPKAALGLTAIVVVAAQAVALVLQVGPLALTGLLTPATTDMNPDDVTGAGVAALVLSSLAGVLATVLAAIVLSGLLTVVVGRAVFGATITIGEAWRRVRGRILALLALTAIELIAVTLLIAIAVGVTIGVMVTVGDAAAFVVGALLTIGVVTLLVYLYTVLSFAPVLIVLERLGVMASFARSFALVKGGFWRVLGILLLAGVVASVVAGAVTVPFSLVGQVMLMLGDSTVAIVIAMVLISVGGAIGQILTAPFNAGVVVLLYTDRRIRAEAFDLLLQTGATGQATSTDDLWQTPQR